MKFELTFGQYLSAICHELNRKLSNNCKIIVCEDQIGMSIKAVTKAHPEYDSIRITYDDWNFYFDTREIEMAYKREIDIFTITETIIGDLKTEFVKQLVDG